MTVYTDDEIRHHRQITLKMALELGPEKFDMSTWFTDEEGCSVGLYKVPDFNACGTSACLAGTAVAAAAQAGLVIVTDDPHGELWAWDVAAWLDIDEDVFERWSPDSRDQQHRNACCFLADLIGAEQ